MRYIEGGIPVERFLTFLPNCGHNGEAMANALLTLLASEDIDINDCCSQSYDNAENMSGKYTATKATILAHNQLAVFVPCTSHSANLVGKSVAECCTTAVAYFDIANQLHMFWTAMPARCDQPHFYQLSDTSKHCQAGAQAPQRHIGCITWTLSKL